MRSIKKSIIMADSCSGGFSVLKYIDSWAGNYNVEYLADYEKNPFGLKSEPEIEDIVSSWFKNLVDKDKVRLFIIACNTASIASVKIKQKLAKEYGVPIINMIEGVRACIKNSEAAIKGKNVAIMATKYTIESKKYQKILNKYGPKKIISIIATNCEREVANGRFNSPQGKEIIKEELRKYQGEEIQTIILACTCFKSIEDQIVGILGVNIKCIDPALEVSNLAAKELGLKYKKSNPLLTIWDTRHDTETIKSLNIACNTFLNKDVKINFLKLLR